MRRWSTAAIVVALFALGWMSSGCPEPGPGPKSDDAGSEDAEEDVGDTAGDAADSAGGDTVGDVVADSGDTRDGSEGDTAMDADGGPGPVETDKLDLLWVIDNSLSMCQEQRELRANFDAFFDRLAKADVDFRIGVTTTHYTSATAFENVAEPGRLQSTPHPPVSFSDKCRYGTDQNGQIDKNNFSPLRRQIEAAVDCTKNPSKFTKLENWTKTELRCAVEDGVESGGTQDDSQACEMAGKPDSFSVAQLFPCAEKFGAECDKKSQFEQVYRDIPKVLKKGDYEQSDGSIDLPKLKKDFACMSFVGTRGSSYEQGLRALRKAVSPQMTGGPVGNPSDPSAPNHGLVRQDSKFMAAFLTDENDCSYKSGDLKSHYGNNKCGTMNCYFPTKSQPQDPPLIATSTLYSDFTSNLKSSKSVSSLESDDVLLASIHGDYRRYMGSIPNMCDAQKQQMIRKQIAVCPTVRDQVRSGDRYADFIGNASKHFPNDETKGLMCNASLRSPLEKLGDFVP